MCGRLSVVEAPIAKWLTEELGLDFHTHSNTDLRPSQTLDIISTPLCQHTVSWGIKPSWSKKLIFNAQSETVSSKKTFKKAFEIRRCLVPCMGWYEWREEETRKQRYLFSHLDNTPILMAGIWYESEGCNQLVTLTSQATAQCEFYHHRMPSLIPLGSATTWLRGTELKAIKLLNLPLQESLKIERNSKN